MSVFQKMMAVAGRHIDEQGNATARALGVNSHGSIKTSDTSHQNKQNFWKSEHNLTEGEEILNTSKAGVLESFVFTSTNPQTSIRIGIKRKVLGTQYFRITRKHGLGSTESISPYMLNTSLPVDGTGFSNEFDLVLYDESSNHYIFRNSRPIHAPDGMIIEIINASGSPVGYTLNMSEVY